MKWFVAIVVFILLVAGGFWVWNRSDSGSNPGTSPAVEDMGLLIPSPTPNSVGRQVAEWKTYSSPRYYYILHYPPSWNFSPFDETNPDVKFGTHTITSYDMALVEKNMDHGIVNWQAVVGSKPAIKVDLSAQEVVETSHEETLTTLFGQSERLETTDLQLGDSTTMQFKSKDPLSGGEVNSYVVFPSQEVMVIATVFIHNRDQVQNLQETDEWKDLKTMLGWMRLD